MSPAREKLPKYLEKYIAVQNYDSYTSRDHAAWRYIMRQNREFFRQHAVPIYLEGLKQTGIPLDRIPRISEMDECLAKLGWGAVPVRGFIPPAAFLDFQARGVLPIASDMRTVQHLAYTPAPDIVHEAAGHAPIIADPAYARYLHRYAAMARKAIASIDDIRIYEAIRYLSDIKENPDTPAGEIARAEAKLKEVGASIKGLSETTMVTRMAWWTVEYGLVGKMNDPKIYGAGLLSSVGESQSCLSSKVKKIPLTVDCVNQTYDITEPQPQLFVTPTLEHLVTVLEDLEKCLAFRTGGAHSLKVCQQAQTVNTVELDSGLQISGIVENFLVEGKEQVSFYKLSGPVQLCLDSEQLPGQGRDRHPTGFSSPLGRWKAMPDKSPARAQPSDLQKLGLVAGKSSRLEFVSGFVVEGRLKSSQHHDGKLLTLTFTDCTVSRGGTRYFQPEWGEFDLAVGESVIAAFGGPADIEAFGELNMGQASSSPARTSPFSKEELSLFSLYEKTRALRQRPTIPEHDLEAIAAAVLKQHSEEWLLEIELLEIATQKMNAAKPQWTGQLESTLVKNKKNLPEPVEYLIEKGLQYLKVAD
jgi:phenylalanine-4-hydroxylase